MAKPQPQLHLTVSPRPALVRLILAGEKHMIHFKSRTTPKAVLNADPQLFPSSIYALRFLGDDFIPSLLNLQRLLSHLPASVIKARSAEEPHKCPLHISPRTSLLCSAFLPLLRMSCLCCCLKPVLQLSARFHPLTPLRPHFNGSPLPQHHQFYLFPPSFPTT